MIRKHKQKLRLFALGLLITIGMGSHAMAATNKASAKTSDTSKSDSSKSRATDLSNGLTQSYNADNSIQIGMVVQLKDKDNTTIVPLKQANIKNMLGVVIPNGTAAIVLTPDNPKQQQVLVAPSGKLNVLISNQNGPVKSGDVVSASSLDGITMKASETQPYILGRAESGFDGKTNVIKTFKIKNSLKQDVNVSVGRVVVDVGVMHNPTFHQQDNDYVPGFIGKIVFEVTSKTVSAARIYLAMVIMLGIIILAANILFGGVRGAMVAVGRNPLSKKSIIVSLIQTVFFASAIFAGGVLFTFFLLKL
jgi:hypothetical protein